MNKGIKIFLGGLLGLIALLILAVVLVVLFVDLNKFKPQIAEAVKQQTGRDLNIQGDLSWSLYPVLGIRLGHTELSNAIGFGTKPMASVDKVSVGVALLPLFSGNLGVSELVLEKPQILLMRKTDGRSNWDDLTKAKPAAAEASNATQPSANAPAKPAEKTPASGKPMQVAIEGIRLVDADITWSDEKAKQNLHIAPLSLTTGPIQPGKPTDIKLTLQVANQNPQVDADISLQTRIASAEDFSWVEWQNLVLKLSAQGKGIPADKAALELQGNGRFDLKQQTIAGQSLTLDANAEGNAFPNGKLDVKLSAPFNVDLKQQTLSLPAVALSALGLNINAKVDGQKIMDAPQFVGSLSIPEFSPKTLVKNLGAQLPAMSDASAAEKFSLATNFSATPKQASLSKLAIKLDDSNLNGDAQVKLGDIQDVNFALALDQINVDRYLPPPSEKGKSEQPAAPSGDAKAPAGGEQKAPGQADPFAWMDKLAVDGKIKVGEATVKKLKLQNALVNVVIKNRIINIDPLEVSLYGGKQVSKVQIDATGKEPKTQIHTEIQTMNFGPFLDALLGHGPVEGVGGASLNLSLQGMTPEAIQKSLTGGGQLSFTDGALRVDTLQPLVNLVAKLQGKADSAKQLQSKISDLLMKFNIVQGGNLNWADSSGAIGDYGLSTSGGLNLFSQQLDTILNVKIPEKFKNSNDTLAKLAGQTIPIKLGGSLTDPKTSLDTKAVEKALIGGKTDELKQKAEKKLEEKLGPGVGDQLKQGLKGLFGK